MYGYSLEMAAWYSSNEYQQHILFQEIRKKCSRIITKYSSGHTTYQNTWTLPKYPWKIQEYLLKTPTKDTNTGFN